MRLSLLGFMLACACAAPAQGPEPELPSVARPDEGAIQRPLELGFFFRKLKALESRAGGQRRVNILHIGDSHLQGDLFSRPLRLALARRFGLAGRGVIFPYSVAHTSNAFDLVSESNVKWAHRRSAVPAPKGLEDLDTGLTGFSIMCRDPNYVLRLGVRGSEGAFDQISIFSRRDAGAFGMRIGTHRDSKLLEEKNLVPQAHLHLVAPGDTLSSLGRQYGVTVAELREWNRIKNDQIFAGDSLIVKREEEATPTAPLEGFSDLAQMPGGSSNDLSFTVKLAAPVTDIFLRGFKDLPEEAEAVIYGAEVERAGSSGVMYHSVGVNGAQLKSFAKSPRFIEQARCLDPDLVIIALGTNEAMSDELKEGEVEEMLLALISGFTKNNPKYVAFLIVTPPDVLNWRGRLNARAGAVAGRLRAMAERHGLALWDWQKLMGPPGSVLSWRESRLVLSDGVHMTSAGYALQARLFYQALMDAYEHY